jgi:hypothetical protein
VCSKPTQLRAIQSNLKAFWKANLQFLPSFQNPCPDLQNVSSSSTTKGAAENGRTTAWSDPERPVTVQGDSAPVSKYGLRLAASVLVGTQAEDVGVVDDEMGRFEEIEGVGVAVDDNGTSDVEGEIEIKTLDDDAKDGDTLVPEGDCMVLVVDETGVMLQESVSGASDDVEGDVLEESAETVADAVAEAVVEDDTSGVKGTDCEIPKDVCVEASTKDELAQAIS